METAFIVCAVLIGSCVCAVLGKFFGPLPADCPAPERNNRSPVTCDTGVTTVPQWVAENWCAPGGMWSDI